jgi:hypothetical protein
MLLMMVGMGFWRLPRLWVACRNEINDAKYSDLSNHIRMHIFVHWVLSLADIWCITFALPLLVTWRVPTFVAQLRRPHASHIVRDCDLASLASSPTAPQRSPIIFQDFVAYRAVLMTWKLIFGDIIALIAVFFIIISGFELPKLVKRCCAFTKGMNKFQVKWLHGSNVYLALLVVPPPPPKKKTIDSTVWCVLCYDCKVVKRERDEADEAAKAAFLAIAGNSEEEEEKKIAAEEQADMKEREEKTKRNHDEMDGVEYKGLGEPPMSEAMRIRMDVETKQSEAKITERDKRKEVIRSARGAARGARALHLQRPGMYFIFHQLMAFYHSHLLSSK